MNDPILPSHASGGGKHRVVTLGDPDYPTRLKEIHDPPARLYVDGRLPVEPMIAIVGSRRATPYGQRAAHHLARDLSEAGVVVVSGLARGIDAAAHRGALEGGTPTVAVMATGLDRIYPPEHADLAQAIAVSGAVITEAEMGTLPLPGCFPVRNRIISGLSLGVVVVEAAQRSGALITARMAAEQGRDVFCVPGSIENPLAVGSHQLIKDGAKLVQSVEDVLDEFVDLARARARAQARIRAHTRARTRAGSGPQEPELLAVWELLDWVEPRHHDDLAVMMNLDIKEVSRRLTLLEMSGYIIGDCGAVTRSSRD
jgi:DNA processing protein